MKWCNIAVRGETFYAHNPSFFVVIQRGWSSLHIACSKGMVEMTELLLTTARDQKNFGKKKDSDCEDMINAKEKSRVKG